MLPLERERSKGFSFIEGLFAIAIVAVAAIVVRPVVKSFFEKNNLRTATKTMTRQLNLARSQTLADPEFHPGAFFDTVDATAHSPNFLADDSKALNETQCNEDNDHRVITPFLLEKKITLKIAPGFPAAVIYLGDGWAKARVEFFLYKDTLKQ
jgi:Tfp pilus assembly protein FimT